MIYSVEDDQAILDLVLYALKQAEYEAEGFLEGWSFLEAMRRRLPRLILLDQMLPGISGGELLKQIRGDQRTRNIPVIMLTARDSELDKVRSLDAGADDYVVKPFGIMELLSRIRAVLRRSEGEEDSEKLISGPVCLDAERQEVMVNGVLVSLTNKEFRLLQCLMKSPGIVFTRDQLMSRVWDTDYAGDTRTVDMHVRTLRVKLGNAAEMIQTRRGAGYRLVQPPAKGSKEPSE